jgi:hypothetical protein
VPNGLYAAEMMRQARATARAQQNQNPGGSNGP